MDNSTGFRLNEINWRNVRRQLLRDLFLILMTALILVMTVQIYAMKFNVKEYSSHATLAVTIHTEEGTTLLESLSTANSVARVYADTFQDQIIRDKVTEYLGYWPANTSVRASSISGTNLILLKVIAHRPQDAYQTITAVLNIYPSVTDYIFENASVEVIKNPQVPAAGSYSFNIRLYSLLAGLLGAGMMTVWSIFSTAARPTIQTVQAADRRLISRRLGEIIYVKKKKNQKGLILNKSLINPDFEEANNRLASLVDHNMQNKKQQIILITSVDENEGKSTVAMNLAVSLRRRNKKVLILDLDLKKPAIEKMLNYPFKNRNTLNAYLNGEKSIDEVLIFDSSSGLYAILNETGISDGQAYLTSDRLSRLLQELRTQFDYIVIDTSPLIAGTNTEELLSQTDTSILVIRQDCMDAESLNEGIMNMMDGNPDFMGYIINGTDRLHTENTRGQR